MILDLGTGDGRAVMRLARRHPDALVVGIDTDAAAMREASASAARPLRKGGVPNALYLAGEARSLPEVFAGSVDRIAVTLPWGALLAAATSPDAAVAQSWRRSLKPGGTIGLVISQTERDIGGAGEIATPEEVAARWRAHGLEVVGCRPVTEADVRALGSSWAKRLGIPARRPAWLFELAGTTRRPSGVSQPTPGRCDHHPASHRRPAPAHRSRTPCDVPAVHALPPPRWPCSPSSS